MQARRNLLVALKEVATTSGPVLGIAVGQPIEAALRPVATHRERLCTSDIVRLTDWRNRFVKSFLTEFTATYEQTANWLIDVVGPTDTRIIFMVEDTFGTVFGYMGLAFIDWHEGTFEVDGVVRGTDGSRGLMSKALRTMIAWANVQLGLREARVRVRSDNAAQAFYLRLGFREIRRIPLYRIEVPGVVSWTEDPAAPPDNPHLIHMTLIQSDLDVWLVI